MLSRGQQGKLGQLSKLLLCTKKSGSRGCVLKIKFYFSQISLGDVRKSRVSFFEDRSEHFANNICKTGGFE